MYKNVNKMFSDNRKRNFATSANCICKGYICTFIVLRQAHTHTHNVGKMYRFHKMLRFVSLL